MRFNIKTEYNGRIYDSKLEAKYAARLDQDVSKGIFLKVESQVKFPLFVNGQKDSDHIVDFVVTHPNGKQEVREVKGIEEAVWLRKLSLFVENYPDIYYTTVKDGGLGRGFRYFTSDQILGRGLQTEKKGLQTKPKKDRVELALSWVAHSVARFFLG